MNEETKKWFEVFRKQTEEKRKEILKRAIGSKIFSEAWRLHRDLQSMAEVLHEN